MGTLGEAIEAYIRAKDENRPHLIGAAFEAEAAVNMVLRTVAISFPPDMAGRDAIAETLVRRFGETFENVYTFCLCERPAADVRALTCDWLVGMSQKTSGAVRVGAGRYDWQMGGVQLRALTITIDVMESLEPSALTPVMAWLSGSPYPWCPRDTVLSAAPAVAGLGPVIERLSRMR